MNYRHGFHAGNFADVLKHAVLARIMLHLAQKPSAFRVIDTHAGAGRYDLAGEEAVRTGEWQAGIGRLLGHGLSSLKPLRDGTMAEAVASDRVSGAPAPVLGTPNEPAPALSPAVAELLAPYLDLVGTDDPPRHYPGSPAIALALGRPQDRFAFNELHEPTFLSLKRAVGREPRAAVNLLDGWLAWNAQVPPPERRGLVLVDPPFEAPGEFGRLAQGLARMHRKWATGSALLWYPIKADGEAEAFIASLAKSAIPKLLRLELHVARSRPAMPLSACGLLILNPPWRLADEAEVLLPALAARLAQEEWTGWRVDWVGAG